MKWLTRSLSKRKHLVAPHWGAWIEISIGPRIVIAIKSHPTGVRGLKCVDAAAVPAEHPVAPHWGAWIEIVVDSYHYTCTPCRTPLGCVD